MSKANRILLLVGLFASTINCSAVIAQPIPSGNSRREAVPISGGLQRSPLALQLHADCVLTTPLIRLRDVASPIGDQSGWWDRAGNGVVGMMAVDSTEMVIDRARLISALNNDSSAPHIDWTGPESVRIRFIRTPSHARQDQSPTPGYQAAGNAEAVSATAVVTDYQPDSKVSQVSGVALGLSTQVMTGQSLPMPEKAAPSQMAELTPVDADRLIRLIQFAIDRFDITLRESYDIDIAPQQISLRQLADVRRVDKIDFLSAPTEGPVVATVYAMTSRQAITGKVEIHFTARPLVVVPRDSLRRGHIISRSDLMLKPAPRGLPIASTLIDLEDAVDMQVVNVLQKDRPILSTSISRPILIERGDLVEIQVIGGGIMVATSGKSLSQGAAGDLIAVETIETRKKVMARVARPGLVEIATRPPRVR